VVLQVLAHLFLANKSLDSQFVWSLVSNATTH
jgi:hypothetical protein